MVRTIPIFPSPTPKSSLPGRPGLREEVAPREEPEGSGEETTTAPAPAPGPHRAWKPEVCSAFMFGSGG